MTVTELIYQLQSMNPKAKVFIEVVSYEEPEGCTIALEEATRVATQGKYVTIQGVEQ